MFLAHMKPGAAASPPSALTERFVFVVSGTIELRHENETGVIEASHGADGWAYMPMGWEGSLASKGGAHLVVYERIFAKAEVSGLLFVFVVCVFLFVVRVCSLSLARAHNQNNALTQTLTKNPKQKGPAVLLPRHGGGERAAAGGARGLPPAQAAAPDVGV